MRGSDILLAYYTHLMEYTPWTSKDLYVDFDVQYDATALKPIPKAFGGSIGLANNHLSVPSQLVSMYKLPPKLSLCLPSTEGMKSYHNGDFRIGGAPFSYLPYLKDASKIFSSTP